jgi:hypothetical protein
MHKKLTVIYFADPGGKVYKFDLYHNEYKYFLSVTNGGKRKGRRSHMTVSFSPPN